MTTTASIQLMFFGNAKKAMDFYTTTFRNSAIDEIEYDNDGLVRRAKFHIENQALYCIDSPPVHQFTFTPSFSIFVDFDEEDEIRRMTTAAVSFFEDFISRYPDQWMWTHRRWKI